MTEDTATVEEQQSEDTDGPTIPRVQIGPHALGGIQVVVRDPQGQVLATRIDLPEATILYSHLGALITLAFQEMYLQAAQAAASSKIVVPGGK